MAHLIYFMRPSSYYTVLRCRINHGTRIVSPCSSVCPRLSSETACTRKLKIGMRMYINGCKKITEENLLNRFNTFTSYIRLKLKAVIKNFVIRET